MKSQQPDEIFRKALEEICEMYHPSKHPFFQYLAEYPTEKLRSPTFLGELYFRYQAACHATRAMVYRIPNLDSPSMRIRKLRILIDDDGLEDGDTHHYQLSRAFSNLGAALVIKDDEFGDLDQLKRLLDPATNNFVCLVENLYPRSLGPWCVVETLANDWMRLLMDSLSVHFPWFKEEPYFADCFNQGIEERHAREALDLTSTVLSRSPELLDVTIEGGRMMAAGIDKFWSGLNNLLKNQEQEISIALERRVAVCNVNATT